MQQFIIALVMFALLIGTGLPVGAQARTDWAAGYASYLAQIKRQCPRDAGRADERAATRGALCTAPHYTRWRLLQAGAPPAALGTLGQPGTWHRTRMFAVGTTPRPGAILEIGNGDARLDAGEAVMVVERVDGRDVRVSEYNGTLRHGYGERWFTPGSDAVSRRLGWRYLTLAPVATPTRTPMPTATMPAGSAMVPELTEPHDGWVSQDGSWPTLSWTSSEPGPFELRVSRTPSFADCFVCTFVFGSSFTPGRSSMLSQAGMYFWRVRHLDGEWSDTRIFINAGALPPTATVTPSATATVTPSATATAVPVPTEMPLPQPPLDPPPAEPQPQPQPQPVDCVGQVVTGFSASQRTNRDAVKLDWDSHPCRGANGEYKVYENNQGRLLVGRLTSSDYRHTGLRSGRTYRYWVRVCSQRGVAASCGPLSEMQEGRTR